MKNLEKFEKYLKGELEESELWEFKKQLEIDSSLAKEFRLYKRVNDAIEQPDKIQLFETLRDIHNQNQQKSGKKIFQLPTRWVAIAASIVILLTVGISLIWMQSGLNNSELYQQYFAPETAAFNFRSSMTSLEQPVLQGMQFYELHDYDAALEMFDKAPNNLMGKLYGGLSLMELGEFDKALNKFDYIIQHNDNLFIDQAEWYLGLCYLRTGKQKQAVETFEKIAEQRGVYKTKAQKILHEINK